MQTYHVQLLKLLATLCLTVATLLAAESDATSLTASDDLQKNETAPDAEELQPLSGERNMSGIADVDTSAYIDRAGQAKVWSDIAPDAWPEQDFSVLLDVLPALYGIQDARKLPNSKKQLSDSSSRPAPSVNSQNPLLGNADRPAWNVRPTYALTAAELREQLQQPRPPRLVDLRRKEDFRQFRMAGSLNIPSFALTTKGFLKRRPFVLLDEGYDPQGLDMLCEELRQAGFEARFLYGGLKAWNASGATLEGDVFAQRTLDRMPVAAFRNGLTDEHRVLVALNDRLPLVDFPQAVTLPYRGDPQEWIKRLEDMAAQWTERPKLFSVVLLSRFGKEYDELAGALRTSRLPNLFVLEGGLQAYQDLLSRELVAQERGSASTDALTGCPNCRLGCQ
ncbi:MAG: rhodanese-like domain-containing protein [bacterium]|nr:rhodanese-like domain-containing protein [bacterium]